MLLNVSSGTDYQRKAFSSSITKVEREPFGHLPNMFSAKLSCPLVHLFFFFTRSYGPVVKICKVFTSRTTHLSAFVLILEVVLSWVFEFGSFQHLLNIIILSRVLTYLTINIISIVVVWFAWTRFSFGSEEGSMVSLRGNACGCNKTRLCKNVRKQFKK